MTRQVWAVVVAVGVVSGAAILAAVYSGHPSEQAPATERVDPASPIERPNRIAVSSPAGTTDTADDANAQRDWDSIEARLNAKKRKLQSGGSLRHDEPDAAMAFFLEQRLPAGRNVLPLETLEVAREEIRQRLAVANRARDESATRAVTAWEEIGPPNIGGRTRTIVINPVDADTLYAAGVAGGVWKSTDAGASWFATDDFMANLAVSSMAMDPTDPSTIYAGTGEGFFNFDSVRGLGIYKTADGGTTWTQLAGTVTGVPTGAFYRVNEIVISPDDHLRIYAATRFGVWKSTDGGTTWSVVLENPFFLSTAAPDSNGSSAGCLDVAIRTDTAPGADTLLAAFGSFGTDGLFRSTDSGATWTQVGTGADLLVSNQGRMEIAFAPSDNDVVYVSMADNGSGNPTGTMVNVFRSTDGGATWSPRLDFANPLSAFLLSNVVFGNGCFGTGFSSQGWYDNVIKVDPADPDIVWVGGIDLFRSDDGGVNFGLASYWYFSPTDSKYVHADQHALTFHPDYDGVTNQTLYSGSDGGLARTDNARAATTPGDCPAAGDPLPDIDWVGLNNDYAVTQFYNGDSARDADVYAGGTQDNGTLRVEFFPPSTDWIEVIGGDGGYFAIDPTDSLIMYGETQRFPRINKSVDGGFSFASATTGITDSDGLFITPFEMDQSNPEILWTGGTRPWRTTNGAAFWELAGPSLFQISAIGIAPSDSEVVYLGSTGGEIARTTDGISGSPPSWTTFGGANGLPTGYVSSIAVHPTDPDTAYCTFSTFDINHVYRTTDGGATWGAIDNPGVLACSLSGSLCIVDADCPLGETCNVPADIPNIPAHWIVVRPCNTDELYVGTELGVFESLNAGATWAPANSGFANAVVETLDLQTDYTLVGFTHGRGAFRTALTCPCDPAGPTTDCNGNSEPDECDIATGASPDCDDNGVPDECEIAGNDCNNNGTLDACETDCQGNGVADDCDVNPADPDGDGLVSDDCNNNTVPDECEADCNGNGTPDDCDVNPSDPDGNGEVSADCNSNSFPDECDVLGGGVLLQEDFESGLPAGWVTTGIFSITGACAVTPVCDGAQWAYAGDTGSCTYGDDEFGALTLPPVTLGPTTSELRYCQLLDTEPGFDFVDVLVNDVRVSREAAYTGFWEDRVVNLTAFAGQTVTITFVFASDAGVSGTRGWQVDNIEIISGSEDCNGDAIPNECDPDCDGNSVPDGCDPDADGDTIPDACDLCPGEDDRIDSDGDTVPDGCDQCPGGDDLIDNNSNGIPDACEVNPAAEAPAPHNRTKNRYISFASNNAGNDVAFEVEISDGAGGWVSLGWVGQLEPDGFARVVADNTCAGPGSANFDCCRRVCSVSTDTECQVDADCPAGETCIDDNCGAACVNGICTFAWPDTIHVGDCEIAPDRLYRIIATAPSGGIQQTPLEIATTPAPSAAIHWADAVGGFGFYCSESYACCDPNPDCPGATCPGAESCIQQWAPPDGSTNFTDVSAIIRNFQQLPVVPEITWVDLHGAEGLFGDPALDPPNQIANFADVQNAIKAFQGDDYPFTDPLAPPGCP